MQHLFYLKKKFLKAWPKKVCGKQQMYTPFVKTSFENNLLTG